MASIDTQEATWITRDGSKLKLSEMTTSHLRNTIVYLRDRASTHKSAYWQVGCILQGEQAQYVWENQMDEENEAYNYRIAMAELMEAELERRTKEA